MKTDELAQSVIEELKTRNLTLATAESCTGGGVGYVLTSVSGSSSVYVGGVVSYSNKMKETVLGVAHETLSAHGAVSEETAISMAAGVKKLTASNVAVSITGIAGPNSDDTCKPVGLVYICAMSDKMTRVLENHFSGSREHIRMQSIEMALQMILEIISE